MNNFYISFSKNRNQIQNRTVWLFILPTLLLVTGLLLLATPTQAAPPAQEPTTAPSVMGGQLLWAENCQPCHGPTGQGDGPTASQIPNPLPNFANAENARQYVPTDNFTTIKEGRMEAMMPPWKNQLSDEQIWEAAAYVWRLGTSAQELATGQQIYTEQCAACHGESGTGDGPQAPAEINDFTDLQTMIQKSQVDLQTAYAASNQHADITGLSEDDIWASLNYARTFTFKVPQRDGVLTGQVINQTTGEPVGNVPVTLYAVQGNVPVETFTTNADESGNYTFKNLATDHSTFYVAETIYNDVVYVSEEPGMFLPDEKEASTNVEVYNSTTDGSNLSITQFHYLLSFSPDAVNVLHIFIVGNEGNETYIGENGQTFAFALPDNATNISFQNNPNNSRFIETGNGYTDTEPVVPGQEGLTVAALYDIPIDGDSLEIALPVPADVGSMGVMMTDQGVDLSSDQLEFSEIRTFQGNNFSVYNGGDISAGETVVLSLSGLDDMTFEPQASGAMGASTVSPAAAAPVNQDLISWIIMGLGAAAIVAVAVVYPMTRPKQIDIQDDDPDMRQQKLLLMLAKLDEAYENGELDQGVYQRARAKYKTELADLLEST